MTCRTLIKRTQKGKKIPCTSYLIKVHQSNVKKEQLAVSLEFDFKSKITFFVAYF